MIYFFIMIVGIILFFFSNQFSLLLFFLFAMPFHNFSFNDIPDPYNYSDNKSWFLVDSKHPGRNEVLYENLKGKSTAVFFLFIQQLTLVVAIGINLKKMKDQ